MKTLSANTQTATDNPHVDPIRLMTIAFGGLTLHLCDRVFGVTGSEFVFDDQIYEPLVVSWDTIQTGRIDPSTFEVEPSEMGATLDNSVAVGGADRFTQIFETYDPYFATVRVFEIYGHTATIADAVDLFEGTLEDFTALGADQVVFSAVGFEADLSSKFSANLLNTTDYPGADPDDVGKMIPQVWGSVRKVRALAADAGGKTTIVADMTASSPGDGGTLEVSDGSFMPAGAFTLQVDAEQIAVASRSGNTLTLASSGARAANGTTAVEHDAGAACAEIQTAYVYIVADHPVKSIDTVYVDNVRQTAGFTGYTGQTGSEYAGCEGKAVVVFTTLPTFTKQINVVADDTIDVDDSIGVSDTIGVSTGSHSHDTTRETITWNFETAKKLSGTLYNPMSMVDGSFDTHAGFDSENTEAELEKAYYESYDGPPTQIRLCMHTGSVGTGVTLRFSYCGKTLNVTASNDVTKGSWLDVGASYNTWSEINAATATIKQLNSSNSSYVTEAWAEFRYYPDAATSPATGVAKTGAASKSGAATKVGTVTISGNSTAETVIGSQINVDLTGRLDDASGTYTGTANAAIERPDHILKHILMACCGLSSARIGGSYATAGAEYATRGYALGVVLTQRPNVRSLLNRIALQARSIEFWEAGVHQIKYIPNRETAIKTIDQNRIDLQQLHIKTSNRAEIENIKTASFNRDWSGYSDNIEAYKETVSAQLAPSLAQYGTLEGEVLSLAYVRDSGQATDVLGFLLEVLSAQRLLPELSGGYFLADVERGDVLSFAADAYAETDFLAMALLGLANTSSLFRVIDKTYRPDGAQQLELAEIIYPVYRASLVGAYDILARVEVDGSYDLLAQKTLAGGYDVLTQQSLAGAFDILSAKTIAGVYDIRVTADAWADADAWGDGDFWGGAI